MIKYNPKTWFDLIFHRYSQQIIRVMAPALLFMFVYTTIVCYLMVDYFGFQYHSTTAFHSLLGITLGLILVFRMNSAYDRWWEGRQKWGELVNNSRNLALKLNAFLRKDDSSNRDYFRKIIHMMKIKKIMEKKILTERMVTEMEKMVMEMKKMALTPSPLF